MELKYETRDAKGNDFVKMVQVKEFPIVKAAIYKKMSVDVGNNANGEPYFIRLSYITSKDLWEKGTLTFIKINYPEIYAKLLRACPDIARFA